MSEPVVRGARLRRRFEGVPAVDGVDIELMPGEIHAIVGLNGAGKTTLMRLLLGMARRDEGEVEIRGKSLESLLSGDWAGVGYLIETPFAYRELTVIENLWMSARLRIRDTHAVDTQVMAAMDRFELGSWASKRSGKLSLGNRQRLGLATATIHDPTILFLDEPANALDPAGVVLVREFLRGEAARGKSILLSSHHLDEIARIAHRITVMHRGRIVGAIHPEEPDLERKFFQIAYSAEANQVPG